jgi:hypothetical protein
MNVRYHTGGRVNEIVGDLIEIDADVLSPQGAAMGHDGRHDWRRT